MAEPLGLLTDVPDSKTLENYDVQQIIEILNGKRFRPIRIARNNITVFEITQDGVVKVSPDGITPAGNYFTFPGMIFMWASANPLPSGYVICDGSSGTPDMRGRFALGADGSHPLGSAGGQFTVSVEHTHTSPPHAHDMLHHHAFDHNHSVAGHSHDHHHSYRHEHTHHHGHSMEDHTHPMAHFHVNYNLESLEADQGPGDDSLTVDVAHNGGGTYVVQGRDHWHRMEPHQDVSNAGNRTSHAFNTLPVDDGDQIDDTEGPDPGRTGNHGSYYDGSTNPESWILVNQSGGSGNNTDNDATGSGSQTTGGPQNTSWTMDNDATGRGDADILTGQVNAEVDPGGETVLDISPPYYSLYYIMRVAG